MSNFVSDYDVLYIWGQNKSDFFFLLLYGFTSGHELQTRLSAQGSRDNRDNKTRVSLANDVVCRRSVSEQTKATDMIPSYARHVNLLNRSYRQYALDIIVDDDRNSLHCV